MSGTFKPEEKFLWLGLIVGAGMILFGVIRPEALTNSPQPPELPESVAAMVNGRTVPLSFFEKTLKQALLSQRINSSDSGTKTEVLEELILKELLLEKAESLGLVRAIPQVQQHLISTVQEQVALGAMEKAPDEEALKTYYQEHKEDFRGPTTYVAQSIFIRGSVVEREEKASKAMSALKGGQPFSDVEKALGSPPTMPLPQSALPEAALKMYLGPTATEVLLKLEPGTHSDPISVAGGHRIVGLVKRVEAPIVPYERVRGEIHNQIVRNQRTIAVKEFLKALRKEADISVNQRAIDRINLQPRPSTATDSKGKNP